MNILVLAPEVPFPPVGGGKLRVYHLLNRLAVRHRLDTVCFLHDPSEATDAKRLCAWGDVVPVPWTKPAMYAALEEGADLDNGAGASRLPYLAGYFESEAYREAVRRQLAVRRYDAVYVVTSMMGQYVEEGFPPAAVDLWNLETLVQQRAWNRSGDEADRDEWRRMEDYERRVFARCAAVLPVSDKERDDVVRLFGHPNAVTVENGVDTGAFSPSPVPETPHLVFTGTLKYGPNTEGILYFLREIWPMVREGAPNARLSIVGQAPPESVSAFNGGPITVTGFVPEVQPYLASARVCIVPLLSGGGTRLKILEAFAAGKAVVSTAIGAEGLPVGDGVHLLLVDTPDDFARATLRVLRDRDLTARLGAAGRQLVEERYDWSVLSAKLQAALEAIATGPTRSRPVDR